MQRMARAIIRTALSLLLCLPNNLIGHKPHTLFLLDTDLGFQMNKPSQAFSCFQLRALTSTTENHYYMRCRFLFSLIGWSHNLSSFTHYRYKLSGMVMPALKDWLEDTFGSNLQHKSPAAVSVMNMYLLCLQ